MNVYKGDSDVSAAFVDETRTSIYVGTNAGQLVWKTLAPIAGASFPLLLSEQGTLVVGSTDG